MKTQWKKVWVKATIWLVTELLLNLVGLDNLADYSEFIFEQEVTTAMSQPHMTILVSSNQAQLYSQELIRFTIA